MTTGLRRRRPKLSAALAATIAAGALASSAPARAQTKVPGFALNQFDPSVPVDAFFGVPSPAIGGHLVPRGAVTFDYAHRPFHLDLSGKGTTDIVAAQGTLRASLSFALWDRLLVSADMPFTLLNNGNDPKLAGVDFHPPSGPAVGDLRVGLRGRIWGDFRDPFQIGLGGYLYAPTGNQDAYAGEGALRGAFHLLLGGRAGNGTVGFVWSAAGGTQLRLHESPLVTYGGAAAIVFGEDRVQIGPEAYGTTQVGGAPRSIPGTNITAVSKTELEILGGIKVRLVSGLFLGAAAGSGPFDAIGTPVVRAIGTLAWTPLPPAAPSSSPTVGDRDGDGIRDDVDACPDVKGELQSDPTKDGCPIADKDHDGVLDVDDACPNLPGPKSPDATKNGCPPDTDEDGVPDPVDACPKEKGVSSSDPKRNGCPSDRDGDGVADAVDACPDMAGARSPDPRLNGCPDDPDGDGIKGAADACPNERGPADPDPKQNGCPKFVRVQNDEIQISAQVQFRSNGKTKRDTVSPVSEELMKEIRDVIQQHPEIVKIEVQGHTDDEGTEEYNQRLSQERADAVRQWLIDAGIPADKLVAKGYGYWKPLADNRIKKGRGMNRRVQFVILERRKK